MVIAGYSPVGPQIGVSSSMSALGAWSYFECKKDVLLIQTGFLNNLEETLLGMKKKKREGFFETKGIDEIIRAESSGIYGEDVLERAVVTLRLGQGRFDLLPSTTKQSELLYEQELLRWLPRVIERYRVQYDCILIDMSWQQKELMEQIRGCVDQFLVFIPQNRWILERLEWEEWGEKDSIILAPYHAKSFINYANLKLLYPAIGRKLIGMIPFRYQYMDTWSKGNAMEYFAIQCDDRKERRNFFWEQIEKIGRKLDKEEMGGKRQRTAV